MIFEAEYFNGRIWNSKGHTKDGLIISEIIDGKGDVKCFISNNILKFEDEYFNGEIRRRKEYYDNGKLEFEGEYLNEERNGKGKEYNKNGEIIFEGEYLFGEQWNGKLYENKEIFEVKEGRIKKKEYEYTNGKLIFEGEYSNGKRDGKGKEYYYNEN